MDMRPVIDCNQQTTQPAHMPLTDNSPNGSSMLSDGSITDRNETFNNCSTNTMKIGLDKMGNSQPTFPIAPPLYPMHNWLQTFSPNAPLQETLNRIYHSFFGLFERQLSQRLEQFASRLDNFQREQAATKFQLGRLERILQNGFELSGRCEDGKLPGLEVNGCLEESVTVPSSSWHDIANMNAISAQKQGLSGSSFKSSIRSETSIMHPSLVPSGFPTAPNTLSDATRLPVERPMFYPLNSPPPPALRENNPLSRIVTPITTPTTTSTTNLNHMANTFFHSSLQSHLFWNQWMSDWFRASSAGLTERYLPNTTTGSFTALLEKIRSTDSTTTTNSVSLAISNTTHSGFGASLSGILFI
ncbi:unnamed protein product [Echinostoma caproni]|uniref:Uncharacterized protein n=1 Tax=Echinostoma caproni TaxID=27848 RepID=A0A183AGG4_9TREM|nr:unnamed protein product [Echinostoma caproni]